MEINTQRLKKEAPHQAVILIRTEIMERLPNGYVTGLTAAKDSTIVNIFGKDFEECKEKTERFIRLINTFTNRENNNMENNDVKNN